MADIIIGLVAVAGISLWIYLFIRRHHWVYHNPYDRRCSVCHRHEVQVQGFASQPYWETWDDSRPGHPCSEVSHDN